MKYIKSLKEIVLMLDYILTKKQKRRARIILGFIVLSSILELISVAIIVPFIQTLVNPVMASNKVFVIFSEFINTENPKEIILYYTLAIVIVFIIKNIALIFSNYKQADFSTMIQKELAVDVLDLYTKKPYLSFIDSNSAELLRIISTDVNGIYHVISCLLVLLSEMLTVFFITIFLLITDVGVALSVMILMLLNLIVITCAFQPKIKKIGKENVEAITNRNKCTIQIAGGIKEILALQRRTPFLKKFEETVEKLRTTQRIYDTLNACPERIIEGVCVSGILIIMCYKIVHTSDVTAFIPILAAFAMAAFRIFPSVGKIISRVNELAFYKPMLLSTYKVKRENEQYFIKNDKVINNMSFKNQIEIKNVSWKYNTKEEYILKNINIKIEKGEAVGIIGGSGMGKTTLLDILLGLIKPAEGNVKVDGQDIHCSLQSWGNIIGYVPQSIYLLDDTIRNNISFGIEIIDDRKIWEALKISQLDEYVKALKDGLDTIVGERGVKFSGGQCQRIGIARAIYSNPDIIFFDEATSALDVDTEKAVVEAIEKLKGNKTIVIISHRINTVLNCNKIYEIKEGCAIIRNKNDII